MNCPSCQTAMRETKYEGVQVVTCDGCGGEFIGADGLRHIVSTREARFPRGVERAMSARKPEFGVPAAETRRRLDCPSCGATMEVGNYGGDSGIFVDRCQGCGGVWLDHEELENVQILTEGWADESTEQIREVAAKLERARQSALGTTNGAFNGSRFAFVNALINRFVDAA